MLSHTYKHSRKKSIQHVCSVHFPWPHSAVSHGPLIFSSSFPDEEGHVAGLQQWKARPSSFFRVANPVTAWPSFLYPPSQVSCKQQYIIQQETFQDTLNLWLNYKNSLITVRFHLWQLGLLIHHQKFTFFCQKHKMMVCLNVGSMNLLYSKFKFHRKTMIF